MSVSGCGADSALSTTLPEALQHTCYQQEDAGVVQLAHHSAGGRAPGGPVVRRAGREQAHQAGNVDRGAQLGLAALRRRHQQRPRCQAGGDGVLVQRASEPGLDLHCQNRCTCCP